MLNVQAKYATVEFSTQQRLQFPESYEDSCRWQLQEGKRASS